MHQRPLAMSIGVAIAGALSLVSAPAALAAPYFVKQSSFFVCDNSDCSRTDPEETSAEIIAATDDGLYLVYSDSPAERVGFVGIADPANPMPLGTVELGAEPTSVAVAGDYLLVAIDTSPDFINPSGELRVYDLADCLDTQPVSCGAPVVHALGGQPDSIAISPDGAYAAIAIENQRDEEACYDAANNPLPEFNEEEDDCLEAAAGNYFGVLPQFPAGQLDVIGLAGTPDTWTVNAVALNGGAAAGLHEPLDPEAEYVDINSANQAIVSLQENNGFALVDLASLSVIRYINAGSADLLGIDTEDERPALILLEEDESLFREPDAVAWIGNTDWFASANEGDMRGGSRGFTLFDSTDGSVDFESYEALDYLQVMVGHYNDRRSDNKGNEPEAVSYAQYDLEGYGDLELLLVGSERSNTINVYDLEDRIDDTNWPPRQVMSSGIGPEGLLPIPGRNLLVVANEDDEDIRSLVVIWELQDTEAPAYPTILSSAAADVEGPAGILPVREGFPKPIAWGALSGLAADPADPDRLYTVPDSWYGRSRIYSVDVSGHPAVIESEIYLQRDGMTVDYDLEGIAMAADGSFWLVSEGSGNAPTPNSPNLLIHVAADGAVLQEVELPEDIAARQRSNGFEGVAVQGEGDEERVYVAFQREWMGDPAGLVRIGEYKPHNGKWKFHWYPLDAPESPAGGWVGLSEITALGDNAFLIVERDNQPGRDAVIKRVYYFDFDEGRTPLQDNSRGRNGNGQAFPYVRKHLVYDLLPDLQALNGWVPDKVEGLAVGADGMVYALTDNDGVDGVTGETHFLKLGYLADLLP